MNALIAALRRLGVGFLYGIGFLVGAVLTGFIVMTVGVSFFLPQSGGRLSLGPRTFESSSHPDQFVFSDTNMIRNGFGTITVLGTLENKGDATGSYIQINADLFDKAGKFIYQCHTQLHEGMRANARENIMVECHGAPKEIMSDVASFKVYVRSP